MNPLPKIVQRVNACLWDSDWSADCTIGGFYGENIHFSSCFLFVFFGGGGCEENFIEISNDQLCMKNTAVSFTLPRQPPFLCIVEFLNTSEPQH